MESVPRLAEPLSVIASLAPPAVRLRSPLTAYRLMSPVPSL